MGIYLNAKTSKFHRQNFFFFVGNMELSCLEVYLQQNFSYSFFSTNASFVTFLQPIGESQTIMGIFLSHSSFQNFTRICQDITSELKTCFSCLACEFKGNTDFIFQEQTSKGKCERKVRTKFIKDK